MIAKSFVAVLMMLVASTTYAAQLAVSDGSNIRCLAAKNHVLEAGTPVVLADCDFSVSSAPDPSQNWVLGGGFGHGEIVSGNLGLCLDVQSGSANAGTPVQLYPCNGTPAQKWLLGPDGLRAFGGSTLCLDVPGANIHNGAEIWIWPCNGTNAQWWYVF